MIQNIHYTILMLNMFISVMNKREIEMMSYNEWYQLHFKIKI